MPTTPTTPTTPAGTAPVPATAAADGAERGAAPLRVQVLGEFRVWVGEREVPEGAWRLQKAKTLVKLLALAPEHRLHRERVAETLWPDLGPTAAAHNLRVALHAARRALMGAAGTEGAVQAAECPYLLADGEMLSLGDTSHVAVDAVAFEAAAADAARRNAVHFWERAAALYTGELLPEDAHEEWAAPRRATLSDRYVRVLFGLARRHEVDHDWPRAVETWHRVVEEHPTNEEAHRALMRLYALAGERRQAMEQYESLRRALREQLDIEPDQESERLRREIQEGILAPAGLHPLAPGSGDVELVPFTDRVERVVRARALHNREQTERNAARAAALAVRAARGTVWTWGANVGMLPEQVQGLERVVGVATAWDHSLALRADGTVWAWGANDAGQLGDGSTANRPTPQRVVDLEHVVALAAGHRFSLALGADGTVWGWGKNDQEQLGAQSSDMCVAPHGGAWPCSLRPTPVRVPTGVVAVSAGGGHCLALMEDGMAWGWGANHRGQLVEGADNPRGVPVQIHALRGVRAVAAGDAHSLALLNDGTVLAWGHNYAGQLGDGTTQSNPKPALVRALEGVTAIAASHGYSLALREDGTLWGWGHNEFAQLGDGARASRWSPVRVGGREGLADVVGMAAGGWHGLAVVRDGGVWGWGTNTYGQVGDGTNLIRVRPMRVMGPQRVTVVAAGSFHSAAVT